MVVAIIDIRKVSNNSYNGQANGRSSMCLYVAYCHLTYNPDYGYLKASIVLPGGGGKKVVLQKVPVRALPRGVQLAGPGTLLQPIITDSYDDLLLFSYIYDQNLSCKIRAGLKGLPCFRVV